MAQAFLMYMDRFDRHIELELARLLDPIVDAPVPRRRRRPGVALHALTGGLAIPSDAVSWAPIAVAAPIAVTVS